MMASIYEEADVVVVRLGGSTEEQEALMPYVKSNMAAKLQTTNGTLHYTLELKGPELSTVIEVFQRHSGHVCELCRN
jgi:hypothetical protein